MTRPVTATERYLTAAEASERMRCHEKTVRRMIRRGELPAVFVAGRWLIAEDDLPHRGRPQPVPPRRLPGPAAGPVTELVRQMDAAS